MSTINIASALKRGGIAVIPTDTIYGIVARARDEKAVARLYRIRRKTPRKPFIVLIDRIDRLQDFKITTTKAQKEFLQRVWPGKVSVIFPCKTEKFSYLHRGRKSLAFRLPRPKNLQALLKKVGPLVAPSANPEGEKPAKTLREAKEYFGNSVDAYVGGSKRNSSKPSTLVSLLHRKPKVLREGAVNVTLPTDK